MRYAHLLGVLKTEAGSATAEARATLERRLTSALRELLRPELVKKVRVTHASANLVLGFILTRCREEDRNNLKDFEVHLANERRWLIKYAVVDGRRFSTPTTTRGAEWKPRRGRGQRGS